MGLIIMGKTIELYYLIAASFIVYFIISYAYKTLNIRNIEGALQTKNGLLLINLKHCLGIILFGFLFYLILPEYRFLILSFEIPHLLLLLIFVVIVFLSAFVSYKSVKKNFRNETEISQYNIIDGWMYFIIRIFFLFSYEYFFRGVLFFTLLEVNHVVIAIIVCTSLYVLIHAFDSKTEIIGAIPFGIILYLFSYFTNSIWPAFIIHITLSGVYELSLFKHLTLKTKML